MVERGVKFLCPSCSCDVMGRGVFFLRRRGGVGGA